MEEGAGFDSELEKEKLDKKLRKLFESGNVNFLIGAGASSPSMPLSDIENKINEYLERDEELKAEEQKKSFLENLYSASNDLLKLKGHDHQGLKSRNCEISKALDSYITFLNCLKKILGERKSTTLPKRINIFTTNYDIFFEKASREFHFINFNDGFNRNIDLANKFIFDPGVFSTTVSKTGNLYEYTAQIPTINLIKLHGSLTWKKSGDEIIFRDMNSPLSLESDEHPEIIFPEKGKFRKTLLTRIYYDLLRTYANELDKENTALFVFGFSFSDEHLYDITKRALKNPTLQVIIFAYSNSDKALFDKKFGLQGNVLIISQENECFGFEKLNKVLFGILGVS